MSDLNNVIISGMLVQEPILKQSSGGSFLVLRLMSGRSFKKQDGTYGSQKTFIDTVVFGKQAEPLATKLSKGNAVIVHGHLSSKEDKEKKRTFYSVNASDVRKIETSAPSAAKAETPSDSYGRDEGDDLPF